MKFKFYLNESRICDFIEFPRLLYYKNDYLEEIKDQNHEELVSDEYLSFITKAEERLKPYSHDIEKFYMKQCFDKYDFIGLITRVYTIFNYKSEKDYLNMLLTLSENEIQKSIACSILAFEQEASVFSEEIIKNAAEISLNKNEMVSLIKNLSIDAAFKWNLFMIIEEPLKHMKMYVELMMNLLPVFAEIYSDFENEVCGYGRYLTDYLNTKGADGLDKVTFYTLDPKIFDDEETSILISAFFPYNIRFVSGICKYIAWGTRIEEAFRKMKEISENKTIERVQIFKNLGDKTRYEVLRLISSGQTSTKAIAGALGVSSATISYHINSFITSKVVKMGKTDDKFSYVVDYKLLERTLEEFKEDLNFPK